MHSSLSSIGEVDGGADTVVDAVLDALGPEGTLAVPTFCSINRRRGQTYDPDTTPSEVGQITNALRGRPEAFRSRHIWQSMSAVGKRAEEMMSVHRPAAWAADGPFWRLYEWDAYIMLLGVPYFRSTFWHLIEQMVQPGYARWKASTGRIKNKDGSESPLEEITFGPRPGHIHDFNKFGARMEARGLVRVGAVGNAMARLYRARDAFRHRRGRVPQGPHPVHQDRRSLHPAPGRRDRGGVQQREVGRRPHGQLQALRVARRLPSREPRPVRKSPPNGAPGRRAPPGR